MQLFTLRYWGVALCLLLGHGLFAQDTLAFQNFETSSTLPVWTYSGNPAGFVTGFSSPNATPPNSPLGIGGSTAWQVFSVSGGNTLTFSNQTIPSGYDTIRVSFRLAAMNLNGSSGGPDNLDYVLVAYSTNGGSTYSNRVRVRGAVNNNCSWPYSAGSSAEVWYLPASEQVFQPVNSGLQVQDGIGYVEIAFPGSITQLSLRITPRSSSSSDHWLVDNVTLFGNKSCTNSSDSLSASVCDSYVSPSGKVFTATGTYLDTIPNTTGCDSLLTIALTVNNSSADSLVVDACNSYTSPGGTVYTASAQFTDTLTNGLGCDSLVFVDLTVNQSAADTLVEDACVSYTSPSGQVYTTSGVYVDSLTTTAGCDSVLTIDLTVQAVDTSVSRSGLTLTAQATGVTYQWINCNGGAIPGATNASFTPGANGDYAVIITDGNCSDTSTCRTVIVVGLDPAWAGSISLWPNPTQQHLNVALPEPALEGHFRILDLQGRLLQQAPLPAPSEFTVETQSLAPGMYFLELVADGRRARLRFNRQ